MPAASATRTLAAIAAASVSFIGTWRVATPPVVRAPIAAPSGAEILQQLRTFRMMATVLHVGAHPDDENTQLITALARGRAVRTAYLSVTRGDGGQNLLGPEFGYKLGLARTQELLAARRIDGGRQFFTRALDFGFSKDYLETFSVWGKDSILSDVVRVIRTFRPDVIVTVFSTQPGGTHGHHTASAVLALEAFKLAADPTAYPEQLKTLSVWQPKRIFAGGRGGAATGVRMELNGTDPVLDESFASIANRSRRMHKTQGFDQPGGGGGGRAGGAPASASRLQPFTLMAGEPATADIFEGIDTTWARIPGGADVERLTADVMAKFDTADASKSVPALLEIRKLVAGLGNDPLVREKKELLDRIILDCAAITVALLIPRAEVVPGETLHIQNIVTVESDVPVIVGAVYGSHRPPTRSVRLGRNQSDTIRHDLVLPDVLLPVESQPYWLREDPTPGMFRVDDPELIGLPENPPGLTGFRELVVGGQTFVVETGVAAITKDSMRGESRRGLAEIPPASLAFTSDVGVFRPGATKNVVVEVVANRATRAGTVMLDPPAGWTIRPRSRPLAAAKIGQRSRYSFAVTAPAKPATASIGAHVTIGGRTWNTQRDSISYPHIPFQLLQPPARFKAVAADIATRGKAVAYIPGAGDDVPQALEQLGYRVTQIRATSVTADTLRRFDAVVIGVRASNVGPEIGAAMPALTAYAEAGGVVIEQYNQNGGLRNTVLGPYQFTIANERVTNENAEVTFLAPDHPVLNAPNKITAKDFEGWVQERGIYFAGTWDERYTPILAMSDANEPPLKGSLIIAKVGKGYFAYTGLVFFRELPAGVPGAYRLFANLVSLGRTQAVVP